MENPMEPTEKDTIGDIIFEWGTEEREEVRVEGKDNSRMARSWANHRHRKIQYIFKEVKLDHVCWRTEFEYETNFKATLVGTRLWKAELRHPAFIKDTEEYHWRFLCRERCDQRTVPEQLIWLSASGGIKSSVNAVNAIAQMWVPRSELQ